MQKTASISNATWDLLLYLSYVDISWQLKISTLHQRSTACSPLPYLAHTILFLGHFWPIYILFQFFGLEQSSSLSDFTLAGEQVCNKDLSTLRQEYLNHSDEDFSRYCFSSAYIVALLHDGLGVPLDDKRQAYQNTIILLQWNLPLTNLIAFYLQFSLSRIEYSNQVGDTQVEWALGAFITNTRSTILGPSGAPARRVHSHIPLLVVLGGFFACGVFLVLRWKKPKTKIIYDLEKGRYIITRISWCWLLCRGAINIVVFDRNRCCFVPECTSSILCILALR
jgi:hypothetical protein